MILPFGKRDSIGVHLLKKVLKLSAVISLSLLLITLATGCGKSRNSTGKQQNNKLKTPPKLTLYTTAEGLISNRINTISSFNNKIWIGTDKGLSTLSKDGKIKKITTRNNKALPTNRINNLLATPDYLLIATDKGLVIHKKNNKWFSPGGKKKIFDLYLYGGKVYCATSSGVSIYDFSEWRTVDTKKMNFPSRSVRSIAGDGEGYFFLGFQNGLVVTDLNSKSKTFQGTQMTISLGGQWFYLKAKPRSCKLPDNNIRDIAWFNNKILLATNNCLSVYNLESWQNYTSDRNEEVILNGKRAITEKPGNSKLQGSKIRQILTFEKEIYIGTEKALSLFNPQADRWSLPLKNSPFENRGVDAIYRINNRLFVGLSKKGLLQVVYPKEQVNKKIIKNKKRKVKSLF